MLTRAQTKLRTTLAGVNFDYRRIARLLLDRALAYGLFWAAHSTYRTSTGVVQLCDSAYSLVVAQKWLADGTLDMSSCIARDPAVRQAMAGYVPGQDKPYHFTQHIDPRHPQAGAKIYYGYPLGSTVLSLPWVNHYAKHRFLSLIKADGSPNLVAETEVQLRIASRVAAGIVVLFYILARFFCPAGVSFAIAAGFAFGSPVWSTMARALWSHTWMVFWLSAAIALACGRKRVQDATWRTDALFGLGLGTALFWVVFVRAQGVFSAAGIGVYLAIHNRRFLLATVAAGSAWSVGLVALSLSAFGSMMPPSVYAANSIDGQDVLNRFAWLMVSPSRGLLVFCPYLVVVAGMLVGFRRHLKDAGLLLPAGLAIAAHTALFSCYNGWHGGSSYGPRYFCDVIPWFVLGTAMAVGGMLAQSPRTKSVWVCSALLFLSFSWGVFVHYRGANSIPVWYWNHRAAAVTEAEAVKDWRHPQFLTGITFDVEKDGSVTELQ